MPVFLVVLFALTALVVTTFFFEPFNIPSGSMSPTLLVGDHLFVSKLAYGYSPLSPPWSLIGMEGRLFAREPERGDVVVFKLPPGNETDYIKRLVGLPGDRIQMRGGILHINRTPMKRGLIGVRKYQYRSRQGRNAWVSEYLETLPNGTDYLIWEHGDNERYDNTPEFQVPPGHYFMLGDNRDSSLDSRAASRVGFVPFENLVGKQKLIFWRRQAK
jgi:signal peptidase I